MKKKMTKLFIGVTVLIAIVISVGCGNNKPPDNTAQSDDQKFVDAFNDKLKNHPTLKDQADKIKLIKKYQLIVEIRGAEHAKDTYMAALAEKQIRAFQLRMVTCEEQGECPCLGGCGPCGPDCDPLGSGLDKLPELFDKSSIVNPGFNGVKLNVNGDLLEVNGQFPKSEDMFKFIDFLSDNGVREAIFNLEIPLQSGNLPKE